MSTWLLCSWRGLASLPSRPMGELMRRKWDSVDAYASRFNTCTSLQAQVTPKQGRILLQGACLHSVPSAQHRRNHEAYQGDEEYRAEGMISTWDTDKPELKKKHQMEIR